MTDLKRLAAYDQMYGELLKERDGVLASMDKLREAGKEKGATYPAAAGPEADAAKSPEPV